jgi:molybdate/tungstate transport system substrate-binding protein
MALVLLMLVLIPSAAAQTSSCVQPSNQQIIIYRAGSLTRAFGPLEALFTCQTGIQVKDMPMGSVDAARQITGSGQACDLYAPADYLDIDFFLKPAGYANYTIVFAAGKMVLAYSASSVAAKKLPPVADPSGPAFNPPSSVPKAVANWYEILSTHGVAVGGSHPFLDPGAYKAHMVFQLAQDYYRVTNLYNTLLKHYLVIPADSGFTLGKQYDFQLVYEHSAQASANSNPDFQYVNLPDEINMSDPGWNSYYRKHAVVDLPGLGLSQTAQSVSIPAARVAWGITILKNAPNRDNAIRFLQLLLSSTGNGILKDKGPTPIVPALVSPTDYRNLPDSLMPWVKISAE